MQDYDIFPRGTKEAQKAYILKNIDAMFSTGSQGIAHLISGQKIQ